jgi:hypothetical protein
MFLPTFSVRHAFYSLLRDMCPRYGCRTLLIKRSLRVTRNNIFESTKLVSMRGLGSTVSWRHLGRSGMRTLIAFAFLLPICRPSFGSSNFQAHWQEKPRRWRRFAPIYAQARIPDGDVCFASHEIKCFTKGAGGIGRALFQQAAHLKKQNVSVTLLLLSVAPDGSNGANLCASDPDAALLQENVVVPPFDASKASAFPFYHAPMQLLSWMEQNQGRCRLVHVADFLGEGAMLLLAKKAGMPSVQGVAVNVQVHGSDAMLFHQSSLNVQPFHPYIHALERIQVNNADSIVFLSRENAEEYKKIWSLPRDVSIIPNILRPPKIEPVTKRPWKVDVRHVFFYGKMTDAKGLKLFLKAISLGSPGALAGKTVHIVGTRFDGEDHIARLRPFAQGAGLTLVAHYDLDTSSVIELFRQHMRDGVVIVPSYIEHQSFALFDVFQSGVPFLASNIFAHRSQIPKHYHDLLLFDPVPRHLAAALEKRLQKPFLWTANTSAWTPVGKSERLWTNWHSQRFGPSEDMANGGQPSQHQAAAASIPGKPHKRFTVAIVSCLSPQFMSRAFSSVIAQKDYPLSLVDVLLVQSCSTSVDNCSSALQRMHDTAPAPHTRQLQVSCVDSGAGSLASVASKGKARNLAVQSARADAVLLLDETDELREDAVAALARALERNAGSGVFTSFSDSFDPTSGVTSLKDESPMTRSFYIGPAPEIGFFRNALGGSHMLVNRASHFWNESGGFRDDISAGCEDWDMLQRAAMVDALVLVPKALVMQQTPPDERTGWSKEELDDPKHIQNVRCHSKMLRDVSSFAAKHPLNIDARNLFPTLLYSIAMHLQHNAAAM